jgi:outer membrane protein insertion porin family
LVYFRAVRLRLLVLLLLCVPTSARGEDALPRYVIERIDVRGNQRTAAAVVRAGVLLQSGDALSADDPRLELSRFRLLGSGLFYDVRLHLERGHERGWAVLVVEIVERGTLVVHELWWGASQAVRGWGGVDLTDTNFVGRGLQLGGAALVTAAPEMPGGHIQYALGLSLIDPRIGRTPLFFGAGLTFHDASEPFQVTGADWDGRPANFVAVHYRRGGGVIGFGAELGGFSRLRADYHYERVDATLPHPLTTLDPGLRDGGANLSMISFSFERDTRADPVLTPSGSRLVLENEFAVSALGSSWDFFKLTLTYQQWVRLRWGHVISFGALAGFIAGDAPIFERYFLGDLDPLMPSHALGLTLSTLAPRNLLSSGISRERYGSLAARLMIEYAIPLFRGGRQVYGGDVFFDVGLVALANYDDVRAPKADGWQAVPMDLIVDVGLRLDTVIGTFKLSLGNTLGRLPY